MHGCLQNQTALGAQAQDLSLGFTPKAFPVNECTARQRGLVSGLPSPRKIDVCMFNEILLPGFYQLFLVLG